MGPGTRCEERGPDNPNTQKNEYIKRQNAKWPFYRFLLWISRLDGYGLIYIIKKIIFWKFGHFHYFLEIYLNICDFTLF